jgi:hypothetical protein
MLKQQTRERLQALVQNPNFVGSVHIKDKKMIHSTKNGVPTFYVDVDIFGEGFNVFAVLAELYPDMKLTSIEPYETDHGDYLSFGSFGKGTIEKAEVRVWATYGQKEKAPIAVGTEEIVQPEYIAEEVMAQ